jgi:DsbC/DsbD-like thiol-disulfide interchange protein
VFDWAGSSNVAKVEVLWPAPSRLEDAGGVSYGYRESVVLPLRVTPRQAGEAVRLGLKLDYGVCKDICIPARAELAMSLPRSAAERAEVSEAVARVPSPQALGAAGDLSVVALAPVTVEGKPMISVAVRAPQGQAPELFVEAPDPWFLVPSGAVTPAGRDGTPPGATGSFLIEIAERPKEASGPLDLRLTLVAGKRAVETAASLDSDRLAR